MMPFARCHRKAVPPVPIRVGREGILEVTVADGGGVQPHDIVDHVFAGVVRFPVPPEPHRDGQRFAREIKEIVDGPGSRQVVDPVEAQPRSLDAHGPRRAVGSRPVRLLKQYNVILIPAAVTGRGSRTLVEVPVARQAVVHGSRARPDLLLGERAVVDTHIVHGSVEMIR